MFVSTLSASHFQSEVAAYEFVVRRAALACSTARHIVIAAAATDRIYLLKGKSTRPGRPQVRALPEAVHGSEMGTVFEILARSHARLGCRQSYLLYSSKKGISSNQLGRTLGVSLKTAWFMSRRIREAMADGSRSMPLGRAGKIVEADRTYIGPKAGIETPRGGTGQSYPK